MLPGYRSMLVVSQTGLVSITSSVRTCDKYEKRSFHVASLACISRSSRNSAAQLALGAALETS